MYGKTLIILAVICSLVGLGLLYWISMNLELERTDIGQITIKDLGDNVKVCGIITNKFVSENNHIFLKIKDETGKIKVVIFSNVVEDLMNFGIDAYEFEKDNKICVIGAVKKYKGEMEIISKMVR